MSKNDLDDQNLLLATVYACIGCSLKFSVKVGVEESIVNAPLVSLSSNVKQIKNTKNAISEVRFKQLYQSFNPWCVHNGLFNANFDEKF
jgi:hypothetical protein